MAVGIKYNKFKLPFFHYKLYYQPDGYKQKMIIFCYRFDMIKRCGIFVRLSESSVVGVKIMKEDTTILLIIIIGQASGY